MIKVIYEIRYKKKSISKRRFLQIVGVTSIGFHSVLAFSKNKLIKIKKVDVYLELMHRLQSFVTVKKR